MMHCGIHLNIVLSTVEFFMILTYMNLVWQECMQLSFKHLLKYKEALLWRKMNVYYTGKWTSKVNILSVHLPYTVGCWLPRKLKLIFVTFKTYSQLHFKVWYKYLEATVHLQFELLTSIWCAVWHCNVRVYKRQWYADNGKQSILLWSGLFIIKFRKHK
jgi:hypothetical protein